MTKKWQKSFWKVSKDLSDEQTSLEGEKHRELSEDRTSSDPIELEMLSEAYKTIGIVVQQRDQLARELTYTRSENSRLLGEIAELQQANRWLNGRDFSIESKDDDDMFHFFHSGPSRHREKKGDHASQDKPMKREEMTIKSH